MALGGLDGGVEYPQPLACAVQTVSFLASAAACCWAGQCYPGAVFGDPPGPQPEFKQKSPGHWRRGDDWRPFRTVYLRPVGPGGDMCVQ